MADFKIIETQEEFNNRIQERIERAEKKVREEYKDWISPDQLKTFKDTQQSEIEKLNSAHAKELEKYAGYDEKFASQTSRIHELELGALKTKVASEMKLPYDAVEFIQGDDEESIKMSADRLSKLSKINHTVGYTRNTEPATGDSTEQAFRAIARQITKE